MQLVVDYAASRDDCFTTTDEQRRQLLTGPIGHWLDVRLPDGLDRFAPEVGVIIGVGAWVAMVAARRKAKDEDERVRDAAAAEVEDAA